MRSTSWAILVGATVVVAAGAAWTVWHDQTVTKADQGGGAVLPGLTARVNDVAEIGVTGQNNSFKIVRQGDVWVVPDRAGHPADPNQVKKTVVGMAELRVLEPRTDNPANYNRLGVGDPGKDTPDAVGVVLKDAKDAVLATLILGKVKEQEVAGKPGEIYVRRPGEKQSLLASARLSPQPEIMRWVDTSISRLSRDRMLDVEISQPGNEPVVKIVRDADKPKEFKLATPLAAGKRLKSDYEITRITGGLDYLTFDDVKKADQIALKDRVVARYRTLDGLDVTVRTSTVDGKLWSTFEAAFNAERAAAYKPEAVEKDGKKEEAKADPDAVKKEAETIAKRVAGWAYQMPNGLADGFTRKLSDMILDEPKDEKKGG